MKAFRKDVVGAINNVNNCSQPDFGHCLPIDFFTGTRPSNWQLIYKQCSPYPKSQKVADYIQACIKEKIELEKLKKQKAI